jgi:hypothetical protein
MLSSIAKDVIAPLPAQLLPLPMCATRNHSNEKSAPKRTSDGDATATSKRIRFSDEGTAGSSSSSNSGSSSSSSSSSTSTSTKIIDRSNVNSVLQKHQTSGLETTIREMFSNYVPTSADRRPFWCRLCQFQGSDFASFEQHRESEKHVMAVEIEKKMAYCKLCKKGFTSMAQLKEHLKGNGHKALLEKVKSNQQKNKRFS